MIVELQNAKARLNDIRAHIEQAGAALDPDKTRARIAELETEMNKPDFWNDQQASQAVNKEMKTLRGKLDQYQGLVSKLEDIEVLIELGQEEDDASVVGEVTDGIGALEKQAESYRLSMLLNGPYDGNNAIIEIHPGAGGTESMDWANMLYRMYTRWCERMGYQVKVLDLLPGDVAGLKSATLHVIGDNAYGYLKAERGVHRLVRISPFDASGRRHTSFASLDVMPELEDEAEIELNFDEIRVDTYHSSGAGGQHVNKTESAVRMTHIPTGIVVQCQNERSQIQNRESCIKVLKARLLELREREAQEKMDKMRGEQKSIEWGSQIRSYVFHPYTMVKDHRTNAEVGNIQAVMDGDLDTFINAYLQMTAGEGND
jgi:peptide chain release factor 2